jgi:hypothetical protein
LFALEHLQIRYELAAALNSMVGAGDRFTGQDGGPIRFCDQTLDVRMMLYKCGGASGK